MYPTRFLQTLIFLLVIATPLVAQGGRFTIQIAAVESSADAAAQVARLRATGLEAYFVPVSLPGQGVRYRVRVGRYGSLAAARGAGEKLRAQGVVREFFPAPYIAPSPVATRAKSVTAAVPTRNMPSPATTLPTAPPEQVTQPQNMVRSADVPTPTPTANLAQNANIHRVVPAETALPTPSRPTPAPLAPGFRRYEDAALGYAFDYPAHWTGGRWQPSGASLLSLGARGRLQMDAGANFNSESDLSFVNAIWNTQEGANSPALDNGLLVDLIVKGMGASPGLRGLSETSRRVVADGGQIRTFVELRAQLGAAESPSPVEFAGKTVILRTAKGILVVAAFYAPSSGAVGKATAEQIVRSAFVSF